MQQPSLEAFHTSPCARGTPALSVQAVDRIVIKRKVQSDVVHPLFRPKALKSLTALLWWDAEGGVGTVEEHPFRANAALRQARTLVRVRVKVMVGAGLGGAA